MLSYDSAVSVPGQDPASVKPLSSSSKPGPANASLTSASMTSTGSPLASSPTSKHHHIWLVTGPAGCGKSTVAEFVATSLNMPYIEGDSFHTDANVEKMRTGTPLTDADRWDWLTALREESMHRINAGSEGVVVTCSALKRKYRDVIRVAAYYDHHLLIHFIYLDASEEVLLQRVTKRENHYMGANMVQSQFNILEPPSDDEKDVIAIDVSRTLDEVKDDALARVQQTIRDDQGDGN